MIAAASRDDWPALLRAVEGGVAVFVVLYTITFVSPRSFGYGDARLGGVLGLYLGFDSWAAVYYGILGGFVLGAGVAIVLLIARRATRKTAIAFGPSRKSERGLGEQQCWPVRDMQADIRRLHSVRLLRAA